VTPSAAAATTTPFRLFAVELTARTVLSDNFVRFTFTGPDLDRFADNGGDQRIKLIFPTAGDGSGVLLDSPDDWYEAWRGLPDDERPAMRTYTIRAVRPGAREIDIDIVLHGLVGVASAWATTAPLGSPLIVCGPNADHDGFHGGVDFLPPARTGRMLLAGDETALPAIANILEGLPADAQGCALLEVPADGDAAAVPSHPGFEVVVVGRTAGGAQGEALIPLVTEYAAKMLDEHAAAAAADLDETDDESDDLIWEAPSDDRGGAAVAETPLYAWLAGEAGVIKLLRRHLVSDRGIDRRSVAFMGYWKLGRGEIN
jgi:NADPH-dependent ferric siderophore reductase